MHTNFAKNTMSKILAALMVVALAVGMLPVKQAYAVGPIAALDAWQTTPQTTGTTGNPANATFSISTGTERLLIVLVSCYDSAGGAGQTFTATYGGKPLTQAFLQNTNRRQTWIGYLNEADITGRVGNTVAVTVTGAHTNVAAYIASYSGVHQTNPITASGGAYVNNTNGVTIGGPLTVNAGGYGIYGWAGSAGLTRVSDTETYTEHSDVNNAGTFDYGVASQAFAVSSSTNPTVTWSANIRASVSFITLNPATSGPLLSAPTATSTADTTATLGATITSNNGSAVTNYGTVWGTSANPTGNIQSVGTTDYSGAFTDARTGLPAGTKIYYRGYADNSLATDYSPDGSFYTEPATQASNVTFTARTSSRVTVNWTRGSGDGVIVVMREGALPSADPVDGTYTGYTASTTFGNGTALGGGFIVYKSTGTSVAITGLTSSTTYHVAVYEYAGAVDAVGSAQGTNYKGTPATGSATNIYGANCTWPEDTAITWSAVSALNDPDDGVQAQIDFVGDATDPGVYTAQNSDYLYFRVRVDAGVNPNFTDTVMVILDSNQNGSPDYAFAWDTRGVGGSMAQHGLEMTHLNISGATWNATQMDDLDGSIPTKISPPDFNEAGDGCIRTLDGQATANFGTTTFIDFAVGWDYLINKSTTSLNNTTAQNWNIQIGSINTGTDHSYINTDIAGGQSPASSVSFPGTISISAGAPTSAVYYSTGSVDATITANWKTSRDGTGTSPTDFIGADTFVIQNGHVMTTSAAWSLNNTGSTLQVENGGSLTVSAGNVNAYRLQIDSGGTVTINSGQTLTINNGASATDMTVNGTLVNSGTFTDNGTMSVGAGGMYQHAKAAGTIPTATWDAASTVNITGTTTAVPGGLAQSFGNFIWNCAGQTGGLNFSGNLTTVNGDFTAASTGSGSLILTDTAALTMTIGGNLTMTAGTLNSTNSTANPIINVGGDVILNGGTLDAGSSGVASYTVSGNWTNNGGAFTARSGAVTFNSPSAQTISGSTSTTFKNIVVNKGSGQSAVLEATGPMSMSGNLTLTNGTFKLTHASATAQFNAAPTIPATAGIWVNGGTLNGGNFSTTNNGLIKVSSGTANFGANSGNSIAAGAGASFIIEGGTLNVAGRLRTANPVTYNQLGGTVNVATVGNASSGNGSFDLSSTSTSFMMSGGAIVLVQANSSAGTKVDYRVSTASPTITGGTLQVGNGSTITNFIFRLSGQAPSLVVDNTTNAKTALLFGAATVNGDVTINSGSTLDSGNFDLAVKGNWTNNNGTFTPGTGTVTFNGSSAQIIGGLSATTFNNLTINNDNGVSLNGVDATVNGTGVGALTFTAGKITTGANTLIMGSSASTVAGAGALKYVYGNLKKAFIAGSGRSFTFEIGDSANYTPAQLASLVVNADGSITAATTTGSHANLSTSNIDNTKYVSRYWTLTPSLPASFGAYNATFTFVPGDLIGAPDTTKLIVQKYSGAAWGSPVSSASTATTVTGTGFTGFSDFAAGLNKNGTTPVTVSYFKAERQGDSVNFTWSTATETGNVGFNLYVETGGELVQINDELIPSQAVDSLDRLDYSYQANVDGNIFYIEDVSVLGDTRRHGPFGLGEAYGGQVDTDTIDWLAVREQNKAGQPRLAPDVMEAAAGANRLDLKVSQTGMYRMTYEMLRAAGLNLDGASLNKIMLTNRGKIVPIYVKGSAKFGPGAYIEFYGKALDTLYTDTNIYTLKLSGRPVAQIPLINAKPAQGSKPPAAYIETMIVQNQRSYASYSPSADPWYDTGMLAYTTPKSYSFPFQVDGLNNPSATTELKLVVWGMTALPQNPDHRLLISINDTQVSSQTFDGMVEQTLNVSVPGGVLQEGANTLQLTLPGDTGAKYDLIYMDKFSLNYARRFQAQDGRLTFTAKGKVFKVTNLPGRNVVVYRSDKNGLARLGQVRVQRVGGTFTATFAGSKQAATYMVSTSNAMYAPAFEAPRPSVNLNNPAQYLIISHPDFINGIQPLVQARQAQGMTVSVVDVNDLYAKYTYGVFDPVAIQQYIAYAAQNLGTQYVLLVGGDTYDYRNYLGVNSISFIPSLFVSTSTLVNFVPVDPLYADLNGDKSPDLAIGRFPVRTVAELDLMVNKTLSYQNKDYARTAVFTSDVFDGVNGISFKNISNALASGLPQDWSVENLHLDDLSVISARERLIAAMNRGAALVAFTGHSGATEWTFSNLFNAGNAAALTNHQRPFVVVQWGCWNTYYVNPVKNYLVQSFLFSGDQGAAAVLGASTLTDSESERLLGELLTPRLVMPGLTLGQALQDAKAELALTHPELLDVLLGWSLMGDPTLVIEP